MLEYQSAAKHLGLGLMQVLWAIENGVNRSGELLQLLGIGWKLNGDMDPLNSFIR